MFASQQAKTVLIEAQDRNVIHDAHRAKSLASKIFRFLLGPAISQRDYLIVSDFIPVVGGDTELARQYFQRFDISRNGKVSKKEMRTTFNNILFERRALNFTLLDSEGIVDKLDDVVTGFLLFFLGLIWLLLFFNMDFPSMMLSLSSIVVILTFALGKCGIVINVC